MGMAGIGTLLSTITINTRGKDVMLAVLFVPLIFPLLYACASATTAVTDTGVCMTVRSGTTDFAVVQAAKAATEETQATASAALRHSSSPDQRA